MGLDTKCLLDPGGELRLLEELLERAGPSNETVPHWRPTKLRASQVMRAETTSTPSARLHAERSVSARSSGLSMTLMT